MSNEQDSRDEPTPATMQAVEAIVQHAEAETADLSRLDAADALEIAREKLLTLQQQATSTSDRQRQETGANEPGERDRSR